MDQKWTKIDQKIDQKWAKIDQKFTESEPNDVHKIQCVQYKSRAYTSLMFLFCVYEYDMC